MFMPEEPKLVAIDTQDISTGVKSSAPEIPELIRRDDILKALKETEQAAESKIGQMQQQLNKAEEKLKPELSFQVQEALKWLSDQKYIADKVCNQVLKYNSDLRNTTEDEQDEFRWEIEKCTEMVYYSLVTGNSDLLDKPPFPPSLNFPDAYKEAFDYIGKIAPKKIDSGTISRISTLFNYLLEQLFN